MSTRDVAQRSVAVGRVRAGDKVSAVAADLGVHPSTVRRWVRAAPVVHEPDPFMSALLTAPEPRVLPETEPETEPEAEPDAEPEPQPGPERGRDAFVPTLVVLEPVILDPVVFEPLTLFPEADALTAARLSAAAPETQSTEDALAWPGAQPGEQVEPDPDPDSPDEDESALEQLQALASASGDAIIRFGQNLPLLERYLLVVAAWLVCVVIGGIAPQSHPGRPVLVAIHLLAMTVAFGSVMTLDWHGILWERRHRAVSESIRLSHALSPLIWSGLAILFVTGALLGPDLSSPLVWLKLVAVLVLALNGVTSSTLREHLASGTSDGLRSLPLGPRSKIVFASVLSQACWLTAVLIGLATTMSR